MKNGFYAGAYFNYCYITDRYENIGFVDDNGVYTSTFENLGHYSNINLSALFNYRYKKHHSRYDPDAFCRILSQDKMPRRALWATSFCFRL